MPPSDSGNEKKPGISGLFESWCSLFDQILIRYSETTPARVRVGIIIINAGNKRQNLAATGEATQGAWLRRTCYAWIQSSLHDCCQKLLGVCMRLNIKPISRLSCLSITLNALLSLFYSCHIASLYSAYLIRRTTPCRSHQPRKLRKLVSC